MKSSKKRHLFAELQEGFEALKSSREDKITLKTHEVEDLPPVQITAAELVKVREELNLSRAVLASYLRTNLRTLENWEQGRAKPNHQAALLIRLVVAYPDTLKRLRAI